MQEGVRGVKRLLGSIERNVITDSEIASLAKLLNYDLKQLKQDVQAIQHVAISDAVKK